MKYLYAEEVGPLHFALIVFFPQEGQFQNVVQYHD